MTMSKTNTIEDLRKHGAEALDRLFHERRAELRRMVSGRLNRNLHGRVDESDVVQNTFLKAHEGLQDYLSDPKYSPSDWLRILNRRSLAETHRLELARRRMPSQEQFQTTSSVLDCLAKSMSTASSMVAQTEQYEKLRNLLAGMSELDREILVLHHVEDLTIYEAAVKLEVSVECAMKRYLRAIKRLRDRASVAFDSTPPHDATTTRLSDSF